MNQANRRTIMSLSVSVCLLVYLTVEMCASLPGVWDTMIIALSSFLQFAFWPSWPEDFVFKWCKVIKFLHKRQFTRGCKLSDAKNATKKRARDVEIRRFWRNFERVRIRQIVESLVVSFRAFEFQPICENLNFDMSNFDKMRIKISLLVRFYECT